MLKKRKEIKFLLKSLVSLSIVGVAGSVLAEEPVVLKEIEVIDVTPLHGVGLDPRKLPAPVQSADDKAIQQNQSLDLTDYMNRKLGSVNINSAQNNPLQPDVQYRGFTASPLLGLPQGLSIYQDSVRINEPFGDVVNWDLIPESSIASINLFGGSNPLFGLNTLGGALSIRTKNGFTHPGIRAEVYGGSFGRVVTSFENGWNNGEWGYFATVNYFDEAGWRQNSPSDALGFFGTVGWHAEKSLLDVTVNYGTSDLVGNGAVPVELLALERDTYFTRPDKTQNDMLMVNVLGEHWLNDEIQISGDGYYRSNDTDSFNGDGSEFAECETPSNDGLLCDGESALGTALEETIEDQYGNSISDEFNAINNISRREQYSYGGNLQATFLMPLFGHENQLIIGTAYNHGFISRFNSAVEVAKLLPDRSTTRSNRFVPDEATDIKGRTRTWSVFFSDTLELLPELNLTFSGRYNSTRVKIGDLSGEQPDLNGQHDYDRFNPAVGLTYQVTQNFNLYGGYSESARAPTTVELACADPDAPCNLPNSFLADPPLEQVVAKSYEVGMRGELYQLAGIDFGKTNWNIGYFHTTNKDDIIFQSTGGVSSNEGFFDNIGDTQRTGMELGLNGNYGPVAWFLNYTYLEATFEQGFLATSPNHPFSDDEGNIPVQAGNRIPGIPAHNFKFGMDYAVNAKLSIGGDLLYNSGLYLRGDEANLLDKTDGYAIVNLRGQYLITPNFSVFAKIENIFDTEYETFGLLGEPDEVLGDGFEDARFLGPGTPLGGWVGARLSF